MSREVLRSSIRDALRTSPYPVTFLTGDAGIGKSTLLRELGSEITAHEDAIVAAVDCSVPVAGVDVGSVEALLPWVELMRSLARPTSSSKKSLIADLALAWVKFVPIVGDAIESTVATVRIMKDHRQGTQEASSREHVFQQCVDFFTAVAAHHRVILMIDDAHWADDSSMNLLFTIARHRIPNLHILVAYRPFDVKTSRDGNEHSLLRIRRELERYDLCTEVAIPPLDRQEIEEIVLERFGQGANTAEIMDRIQRFSAGNPLLAHGFTLEGTQPTGSVGAVVRELISRLDGPLKELLMLASAEGETFTSPMLIALSGRQPLEIASSMRRAEQEYGIVRGLGKRIVYANAVPAYEFSNDAIHAALYDDLGEEEREILHGLIADIVKREREHVANDPVAWMSISSRLAAHRFLSGDHMAAASAWLGVAQHAWEVYAEVEAISATERSERILEQEEPAPATRRLLAEIYDLRGRIAFFLHRIKESHASFMQALDLYREIDATHEIVIVLCKLASIANVSGDPDAMKLLIDEALALATSNRDDGGVLAATSMLGLWYETKGLIDEAVERHLLAEQLSERLDDQLRLGSALTNRSRLLIRLDKFDEARDLAIKAIEIFKRHHHWEKAARTLNNLGIILVHMHDLDGAARAYQEALTLHDRVGDRVGSSSLRTNLAQMEYERGNYETAFSMLNDSIAQKVELGERYGECIARYSRGLVLHAMGRKDEALRDLEEARTIAIDMREQLVIDEIDRAMEQCRA